MHLWRSPILTNLAQGMGSQGRFPTFPRTMPRQVQWISRDGDSTTPLGNLCQHSCAVTVNHSKKSFIVLRWYFLCFSLCPLPLFLSLGTTEDGHCFIFSALSHHIFVHISKVSQRLLFIRGEAVQQSGLVYPKRQLDYSSFKAFFKSRMLTFLVVGFELGFFVFPFLIKMED